MIMDSDLELQDKIDALIKRAKEEDHDIYLLTLVLAVIGLIAGTTLALLP